MKFFYASRLSDHTARSSEGFLFCFDTPLCRTGEQQYRPDELGLSGTEMITVIRPREEVLSPETISSFEGKPLCGPDHPPTFLNDRNAGAFSRGHVQDVRPSSTPLADGETALLGTLVVTDLGLIESILTGRTREVSAGYSCVYAPNLDGTYTQRSIRCNHIACVASGRAGSSIRIQDTQPTAAGDFGAIARQFHRKDICAVQLQRPRPHDVLVRDSSKGQTMDDADIMKKVDLLTVLVKQFVSRCPGSADRREQDSTARSMVRESADLETVLKGNPSMTQLHNYFDEEFRLRHAVDQNVVDGARSDSDYALACNRAGSAMRGERAPDDWRPQLRRTADARRPQGDLDREWEQRMRAVGAIMRHGS